MGKTQSEVGLAAIQVKWAKAQYDYKIAEATLAVTAGGNAWLQIDLTMR